MGVVSGGTDDAVGSVTRVGRQALGTIDAGRTFCKRGRLPWVEVHCYTNNAPTAVKPA